MFRRLLCFLPSKCQDCYTCLLEWTVEAAVVDRGLDISRHGSITWSSLMCDFELGIHNAFEDFATNQLHIANLVVEGCHMHYC